MANNMDKPQASKPARSDRAWSPEFFDEEYARFALLNDERERIERIVAFICDHLQLDRGDLVFDQCCGVGRVGLPLAERGIRVVAVDLVEAYIERARRAASEQRLPASFYCADAFRFVTPEPCDAVVNWFTSFGYCEDDTKNLEMLARAYESLKPGGRFILEMVNVPRVLAAFRPSIIERHSTESGELIVLIETRQDFVRGMFVGTWTFIRPDGSRKSRDISTRIMMPHELVGLLRRTGFDQIELLGWPDGEPFNLASRRLVALARRT